jgi:hypothetical protein
MIVRAIRVASRTALLFMAVVLVISASKATEWSTEDAQGTAQYSTEAGPSYASDGRLEFPAHYREWIYLSSGIDMEYSKAAAPPAHSMFDNVFVEPTAYRSFVRTGKWPDGTMLVLESRAASEKGSINQHGKFQAGEPTGVQVHLKDSRRFKGDWAFFSFDGPRPAAMIPLTQECYSCHQQHAAVDTTFVQFYPTLLAVARGAQTLKPGVDVLIVVPVGAGRAHTQASGNAASSAAQPSK